VPFRYSGNLPAVSDTTIASSAPGEPSTPAIAIPPPSAAAPAPSNSNMPAPQPPPPPAGSKPAPVEAAPAQPAIAIASTPAPRQNTPTRRFFRHIGHFFSRLFGAEQ
jgi:hypothetical protein